MSRQRHCARQDAPSTSEAGVSCRELASEALLAGRREIVIRHGAEVYRLRLTRQNKLILTK